MVTLLLLGGGAILLLVSLGVTALLWEDDRAQPGRMAVVRRVIYVAMAAYLVLAFARLLIGR